ncbi:MAG TPA: diguanylate cyclase [Holophagaceae bacterium]|jgi:diguanylate cyclase (GGDEF)-like protein|nr:diguanylate cyclase [Holophagaceae bacterium]
MAFCAMAAQAATREQPFRTMGVYGFKSYGGDQGLTTLAVSVMTQDEAGFLWVGTEDGLFRYDGESFHRFGTQDGLPDTNIAALAPAADGSLWVLTKAGLARFAGGRFVALTKASGLPATDRLIMSGPAMVCDAQSRLWIATLRGLYLGGPSGFWPVEGLPKAPTACVWINPSDGTVLTAQVEGRIFHSLPGGAWAEAKLPVPHEKNVAQALVQDTEGRTWARGDGFIVRFDRDWKHAVQDLSKLLPLKPLRDFSLFADARGRVWAPTQSGLDCFQGDGGFLLDDSWGLPGSWAGSVLVDSEGSLWVGSEGVHRVQGRMRWTASTRRQGLPSDTIWAIARTEDGRVWAGTQGGLALGSSNGWSVVPDTKGQPVIALLADAAGGLWAAANPLGSDKVAAWHLVKGGGGAWVGFPGGRRGDSIQSFSQAEDGTIWAASAGGGLWRIPSGGSPIAVTIPGLDLRANFFAVLARKGAVFLSTDRGLAVFDQGAWRILGTPEGLKSANTQAMAMTAGGELWITYASTHGLSILKQNGGSWAVTAQVAVPALTEDGIVSMAFDAKGCLWLGTSRGVKRWDGQTCQRFGRGEGLPGEDADGNAVWMDQDAVWFGMSNGLARFDASGGFTAMAPPGVRIMQAVDGGGHALLPDGNLLRIPYAYRTMDFDYAVPSYLNEGNVRLQVRLQGFENEWRDTKSREARYTALPPGDYRFEARAAIGAGPFGNADTVDFRILAPWWRTWWFYALCFVFAAALVLASVRWRTAVLEKRNRSLEALVRARTLDLERANEQLQESSMVDALTGLKNRRYLGMNLPEEESRVMRAFRTLQATGRQPTGEDLVFLLVDLDYFKAVNDTHGHAAGDAVLKLAAEAIRSATREADTVARWGGEEFLVIARRADRHTADVIARKILDEVRGRAYPFGDGQELRLTCSVGFSAFPVLLSEPGAFGWEEVVEIADQCLYAAKRTGRDGFVGVYLDSLGEQPDLIRRLLHELPKLVGEGKVALRSSFGEGKPLDWKQGH